MDKEKFNLEAFPTSESALRMLGNVTQGFYDKSYVGKWLYQVMGLEYDEARKLVEELPYQMFPETATWGLMYHEMKWQLPVRNNLSYQKRRQLIYQKRDYRAPMTPYRMETYLKNATGFDVFVADVHDSGPFNYQPAHPNVFKAYFVGEGTLNAKAALQMIQKLKQSHTTYIINDHSAFIIDSSTLEQVLVTNIRIAARIPFWRTRLFDGSEIMDGSHLMDAVREYDLRLGIMYREGEFVTTESADLVIVALKAEIPLSEKMNMEKQTAAISIDFWRSLYFDGSILMDGKRLMNYSRQEIKAAAVIRAEAQFVSEEFGNATVTSRRNLAYFDGSLKMDGSRLMNSINRKEAI